MDRGAALEAMRGVRVPQPVRQDRRRQARALRGSLHDLSPLPKLNPTLLFGRRVSGDGFEIGSGRRSVDGLDLDFVLPKRIGSCCGNGPERCRSEANAALHFLSMMMRARAQVICWRMPHAVRQEVWMAAYGTA